MSSSTEGSSESSTAKLDAVGLKTLPFEFAASGPPAYGLPWVPPSWEAELNAIIERLKSASGPKSIIVVGEYGSGKSVTLRWLAQRFEKDYRIRPFSFSNPGVTFYSLANDLLGSIGRKEFAKVLWELAASHVSSSEAKLFSPTFEEKFRLWSNATARKEDTDRIADALRVAGITLDEEVAYRLGRLVTECAVRPYVTYGDFTTRDGLAAEGKEPDFFSAILRALRLGKNADACAFLIDEFEEISLGSQVTTKVKQDYTVTLKRLFDAANTEQLWVVLGMIPDGRDVSKRYVPAAWQRLEWEDGGNVFSIPSLTPEESREMVENRLTQAGASADAQARRFTDAIIGGATPVTLANPRKLIRLCARTMTAYLNDPEAFSAEFVGKEDKAIVEAGE